MRVSDIVFACAVSLSLVAGCASSGGGSADAGVRDAEASLADSTDAARPADGASPGVGGSGLACAAGTLVDGGTCQACGLNTCASATCDDGTAAAALLGIGSLDCLYRSSNANWATAMNYCMTAGAGWRLPSKGEALKVAATPGVCRTGLPGSWWTWTTTCSAAGLAWFVQDDGRSTPRSSAPNGAVVNTAALCVR